MVTPLEQLKTAVETVSTHVGKTAQGIVHKLEDSMRKVATSLNDKISQHCHQNKEIQNKETQKQQEGGPKKDTDQTNAPRPK